MKYRWDRPNWALNSDNVGHASPHGQQGQQSCYVFLVMLANATNDDEPYRRCRLCSSDMVLYGSIFSNQRAMYIIHLYNEIKTAFQNFLLLTNKNLSLK